MGIYKTILYPFSIGDPYFDGYAWAMELAGRLNAKLQLFTTTGSSAETATDSIYQSLLEAHGYYLHHFTHDRPQRDRILREQHIVAGDLHAELKRYLQRNSIDILVVDPSFNSQMAGNLKEIIQESGGAIILSGRPDAGSQDEIPSLTETFYNQLRRAEFYKIPENFFASLRHDPSVFNYLRKLFQKSVH